MSEYYNTNTTDPKDELLSHVDDNDIVIDGICREECHNGTTKPWHRNAHVYIVDSQGNLYLTRRSNTKDTSPGGLTVTTAGHVRLDEDPELGAERELKEELCLDVDIHFVKKYKVDYGFEREYIYVYFGKTDQIPQIGNEEVGEIFKKTLVDVIEGIKDGSLVLSPGARDVIQMLIKDNLLKSELFV